MDKNTDFRFLGMTFTLVVDREVPEKGNQYYIEPGKYEMENGKEFDFFISEGMVNPDNRKEILFHVHDLDEQYSDRMSEKDLSLPFSDFYVFTGEDDEPEINVTDVNRLVFHIMEGHIQKNIPASAGQMESISKIFR